MLWTALALAQTAPGGSSPAGTATGANTGAATSESVNWVWIGLVVVVVAGALFYFVVRRRGTRV
jgi:heme/copper-type cytochrome/quinol oxidase subunit 2